LNKVSRLPITEWNYRGYTQRHIGPTAQDFHEQFPLNDDDTTLNEADLHGVALAAIQGLNQKVEERSREQGDRSKELEARSRKLEAENAALKARLARLEQLVHSLSQTGSGGGQ
jgi:hypothetical protein